MTVTFHVVGIETDLSEQPGHPLAPLGLVADTVNHQRLSDDVTDLHARISRRTRILENDLHLTAQFSQLALAIRAHVASFELYAIMRLLSEPQLSSALSR